MAKKAATVVVDLDIKLASGKSKAAKPDQLLIDDTKHQAIVDKCIELDHAIENLKAELGTHESQIIHIAACGRENEFNAGNFVKTVNVAGSTHKLQIQFKDSYSKMESSMEEPLKTVFGSNYPVMFRHNVIDSLRDEKKADLKSILGTRWAEFFATEENIQPSKDFQQTYFMLRKNLKQQQTDSIQKILDACQAKPSVKYPK